jgi:ABC-type glycerol-3-phosphate transport system substrate-binding protein
MESAIVARRAAGLAVVLFLSGCAASGAARTTLRVWDFKYGDPAMGDVMREYDRAFEAANPGTVVEHRALSDVDDDKVLAAAIAANAAPDVAMVHGGAELRAFAVHFAPLDPALGGLAPRLRPDALDACRNGAGELVAVPLTVQGFGWYYNKALFRSAGLDPEKPPRAWDDFLAACAALGRAGYRPIAWGNNPPYGTDWLRRALAVTFFAPGEIPSLFDGPAFADDKRFERIMALIRGLRDRAYLDDSGTAADHIFQAAPAFARGEAGLYFGLLSDIANWKVFSDALGPGEVGFFGNLAVPGAAYPGRSLRQPVGIAYAVLASGRARALAERYAAGWAAPEAAAKLIAQVGALVPLAAPEYPLAAYPVLDAVFAALADSGDDPELYYDDLAVKDALLRYDELFIGTREIGFAGYRWAVAAAAARLAAP